MATDDRRPTSAAHSMLFCQSLNKPGCVRGLPSSAARNDLTQPRTSSRYGLRLRTLPWGYLPVKCLTPVNITHILLWYNSSLRVVSSTLRLVRIINKHNISSWVTLHNNTISSLFLHTIIWKVLMPPCIHFHVDPVSILVVIEHITFTSVFSTTHVSLSIDFTSTLAEVWSQTNQFLDRPLGAPLRRANIRPRYRPSNGSRHTQWEDNAQSGPEGQVFPGIVTQDIFK